MILYHGSSEIVGQPIFGKGKTYNDYGQGFYCTEHMELAKEWACTEGVDGYVNKYQFNTDNLRVLNLSSGEYSILHWLALLVTHRKMRLSTPVMKRGVEWLQKYFLPDISEYDVMIGYRADDSYFAFARAFLNNQISLAQLGRAMRLGRLGEQVVLKSEKAFERIQFDSYFAVANELYYAKRKARDCEARAAYAAEVEKDDIDGIFMRDIILKEMKPDDVCLR